VADEKKIKLRVRDDPGANEIYANKFLGAFFDGSVMTIALGVTRFTPEKTDTPPEQGQHPAVHIVGRFSLSPPAVIELVNALNKMLATMSSMPAGGNEQKTH
jgi:hypothetical protein